MFVVIYNGFGGVIFYEVVGYFFEIFVVFKGLLLFVGKFG